MRLVLFISCFLFFFTDISGQGCCSGGSGSPIAGGGSQGVLADGQMEIAANHQYFYGNKFKAGNSDTASLFHNFHSNYIYSKIAYGLTKSLTLSIEAGYFINKTQVESFDSILNEYPIKQHSGISDLIIFPRYDVLNRKSEDSRIELTIGLGYKIPIGKHNDSDLVYTNPNNGQNIYAISPTLIQPTNGSQDLIFYAFFLKGFPKKDFRLFTNAIYIRKGWNSLGEKFGDYASAGIFVGKTFFDKIGLTLELKGEKISKLQAAENMDLLALYNVDINSTGSKKISFVPQISYSHKQFTFFALGEFPLYEHINGVQIASKYQMTSGLAYRFLIKMPECEIPTDGTFLYVCPMNCKDSGSNKPGRCKECGMKLVKAK